MNLILAIIILVAAAVFLYAGYNRPSDENIYRDALRDKYHSKKP